MAYVLDNSAPDGRHVRSFKTAAGALKALAAQLGRDTDYGQPIKVGETYYSDFGNVLTVKERPAGHTARAEVALFKAYDARECGTATKRQLALLATKGF